MGSDRYAPLKARHAEPVPDVSGRIAADDAMHDSDLGHYGRVGQSAWRCITLALLACDAPTPRRVLDLPCGHGRVLRVLRRALPDAELTACDLDRAGVDFCRTEFGAHSVYSDTDLRSVVLGSDFDLIWCGSLLTHLDAPRWLEVLRAFVAALRPGGVAVVTVHGRLVADRLRNGVDYGLTPARITELLRAYDNGGFGYVDYPDRAGYGVSLSSPAFLFRELAAWFDVRVVSYAERQWDDHQDVLAFQRL
jgi:SAM-dependent methyltransferase